VPAERELLSCLCDPRVDALLPSRVTQASLVRARCLEAFRGGRLGVDEDLTRSRQACEPRGRVDRVADLRDVSRIALPRRRLRTTSLCAPPPIIHGSTRHCLSARAVPLRLQLRRPRARHAGKGVAERATRRRREHPPDFPRAVETGVAARQHLLPPFLEVSLAVARTRHVTASGPGGVARSCADEQLEPRVPQRSRPTSCVRFWAEAQAGRSGCWPILIGIECRIRNLRPTRLAARRRLVHTGEQRKTRPTRRA
jgi:hypothetical protein